MTDSSPSSTAGPDPKGAAKTLGPSLLLADSGASDYRIVLSASASPSERHAATELQMFLEQICGARLPIATDEGPPGEHEIILGDNAHLAALGIEVDFAGLGDEGFVIRSAPAHLVIAGGRLRGTMYGVYTFLEDHLGCRWFTSSLSHIPRMARLEVGAIDERQTPALEYREAFFHDAFDPDWCARNKMNSSRAALTEEHGGKVSYYPFVHSFFKMFPPDQYFESHPEWFSLVDGERTVVGRFQRTQLCLTNEEMIQEAIKVVKGWIHEHPEATIVSVSQNDGPGGWCECENCAALEAREGGVHSAPIIHFVNRIAEAIADEHPKIAIDTLAYSYASTPPTTLKPLPNVIIRICTGGCHIHPMGSEKCAENGADNIRAWFKLTKRIYIWDYIINFRQYLLPFPNLGTLGPNIRFLVEHGVRGIFEQGSGDVLHSDMAPLKAYLVAKLLWNPYCDEQRAISEFLAAYFGPAAKPIGAYLESLRREVESDRQERNHVIPFVSCVEPTYLTPELLARAVQLFDEAERLAADDPERLLRVQTARLSLDYVKLSLAARLHALMGEGDLGLPVSEWYRTATDRFFSVAERGGVTHIRESSRSESTMDDFRRQLATGARRQEGEGAEIE
jgi:hypothetical protein